MHPFSYIDRTLWCEKVPVRDLLARFGSPLYVYSGTDIVDRCREIRSAFGDAPGIACYAVKANANPHILRLIAGEGLGADIGSAGELHLALTAGFAPEAVTFSGVGKRDDEIEAGLAAGIHAFAVESREEIDVINGIAARRGAKGRILLRVNLDIDAGTHKYITTGTKQNKFGVPWQQAWSILRHASELPHIDVRGVHSHIGSQILNRDAFVRAAKQIVELARDLRARGIPMHELDFGGGFGVQYRGVLRADGLPDEDAEQGELSPAHTLKQVIPILRASGCRISIQPGRSIVAQAGALCVTVLYRKTTDDKVFIVTDGGMNDLIRPSLYGAHHQIVPVSLEGAPVETVDVVGPVCESGDFFAQDRRLPRVTRGDALAVLNAGAYGFVLSSNYNARLRPAEVLVTGGDARIVRPRQTLEDLD